MLQRKEQKKKVGVAINTLQSMRPVKLEYAQKSSESCNNHEMTDHGIEPGQKD